MESFFDRALVAARRLGASDVHLKPGLAPILRIARRAADAQRRPPLSREFLQSLGHSLLNDRRREQLERTGEVVLATATSNGGRQRVHVFHHRAGLGLSLRLVPPEPPTLETLGLPPEVRGADRARRRAWSSSPAAPPAGARRRWPSSAGRPGRPAAGQAGHDRGPGRVPAEGPAGRRRAARGGDGRPHRGRGVARGGPPGPGRARRQRRGRCRTPPRWLSTPRARAGWCWRR